MESQSDPCRVVIFPLAAQGHVNSMLKLAELIALSGIHVTFLSTDHINDRLLRHTDVHSRFSRRYPGFLFRSISDGLSADHPRSGERIMEVVCSINETMKQVFKQKLVSGEFGSVTCIIADGIFGKFTTDVANELRMPIIHFRTISACSFWAYLFTFHLIESGELPIRGKEDMDRLIKGVPGMEEFLRCRDFPTFGRVRDLKEDNHLNVVATQTLHSPRANGLILNTFEDLEGPIISHIRTKCPKIYSIGPLNAHLSARLADNNGDDDSKSSTNGSLLEVDNTCMRWLDARAPNSVVYVSFGSHAVLTKDDLLEFWHGLVNSKRPFLWVIRHDLLVDRGDGDEESRWVPRELSEGTEERGFVAEWVQQEEVLSHKSVGGFLTHSGWNSTLESIVAGVPMICWPYFADQPINSRYVDRVWRLGIDMKDVCDRKVVEKMVNELMVERREEFARSADEVASLAVKSVTEGGSSYRNLECLVEDIRFMSRGYNLQEKTII